MKQSNQQVTNIFDFGYTPEQMKKVIEHVKSSAKCGKTLTHMGYCGTFKTDNSGLFYGKIDGIPDLVTFEAPTEADVEQSFIDAVEDYIQTCENLNQQQP